MSDNSDVIYPFPARILRLDTRQPDMSAMMDLLKQKHMMDPSMLDERTPFFWTAEISNDQVDSYFTHMLPSTLTNFANDASAGVSFLNSHRHNELPLGKSINGQLDITEGRQRVLADFYTIPGLNLNGIMTDDFINGVKSGIVKDTSVGFTSGQMWCDVCKMDYRSWDCPHVAGMKYEIQGGGQVTATVGVDNARLAEVSAVFDGSTPDATILKAERMIREGELKPDAVRMLEARYRMTFATKRSFAGVDLQGGKKLELEKIFNQLREVLALPADGDAVATVASLVAERDRLATEHKTATTEAETLRAKVLELEPQAKDGAQYRTDLITEALGEGVRAYGDKFAKETYETLLRTSPLAIIKQMKADWAILASERFKGGRQTVDNSQAPGKDKAPVAAVPDAAFKTK
jgi:hypothetical protein